MNIEDLKLASGVLAVYAGELKRDIPTMPPGKEKEAAKGTELLCAHAAYRLAQIVSNIEQEAETCPST